MIGLILLLLGAVSLLASFLVSMDSKFDKYYGPLLVTSFTSFVLGGSVVIIKGNELQKAEMQECVQGGGQWLRYSDSGFACVGEKK